MSQFVSIEVPDGYTLIGSLHSTGLRIVEVPNEPDWDDPEVWQTWVDDFNRMGETVLAVTADTYPNCPSQQEMYKDINGFSNHPKRPVVMRGCKYETRRRIGRNYWAQKMYWRALKLSKFTEIHRGKAFDFTHALQSRIARKVGTSSHFCRMVPVGLTDETILINGEFRHVKPDQIYPISLMFNTKAKLERLNRRIEKAKKRKAA